MHLQVMFYIFEAMSFKFFIAYLKHQLTANNRHGTHSPFVYKLADEVIYDFSDKKVYRELEEQRKKLFNDGSYLAVNHQEDDSTSRKNSSQQVKVLAKSVLKKPRLAQLIFRLAQYGAPKQVMVFDANFGISAAYLAKACPLAKVTAIENCAGSATVANQMFEDLGLNNVTLLVGNFAELLPTNTLLDFVYIDGNQSQQSILAYFNWCLPQLHEQSIFICNDIHKNEGMEAAWAELKKHPQVTVTIDLFWLGLVYFRKGQAKEHFKLKF
jgi:predicted O-methyltransferase YrrM